MSIFVPGLVLGIDGGTASVGMSLIQNYPGGGEILAMYSRTFNSPETPKEKNLTNAIRREHRGARRVNRRRAARVKAVRRLLADAGFVADPSCDPGPARDQARLSAIPSGEFAAALIHIAKHRGFRSNRKGESVPTNQPIDVVAGKKDKKVAARPKDPKTEPLLCMVANQELLSRYETVGHMRANDPKFAERKCNSAGDYSYSVMRADLEYEVGLLFARQRRFGVDAATEELEAAFTKLAFDQKTMQGSAHMVGCCLFEPVEKRGARRAPSYERNCLLTKLHNIVIQNGKAERRLTQDERTAIHDIFGKNKTLTYQTVRKLIGLHDYESFKSVPRLMEGKDVVAWSSAGAEGLWTLRKIINAVDPSVDFAQDDKRWDDIAAILSFENDLDVISNQIKATGVSDDIRFAILEAGSTSAFDRFVGAGSLSTKVARDLNPLLLSGLDYVRACETLGYDHAAERKVSLNDIGNPVVRKAVGEIVKQFRAVVAKHGLPERVNLELSREMSKTQEERQAISSWNAAQNKNRDRATTVITDLTGNANVSNSDIVKYNLWNEQSQTCAYSGKPISIANLFSVGFCEVDHILPRSRTGDDSYLNKCLVLTSENRNKGSMTPFEFMGGDSNRWAEFSARIRANKNMKATKKFRYFLLEDSSGLGDDFVARNATDNSYIARAVLSCLKEFYPDDGKVHVFAYSSRITNALRLSWGLQHYKKDGDNVRVRDNRHHALDAVIAATMSPARLQQLTKEWKRNEEGGIRSGKTKLAPPWPTFVEEVEAMYADVFVTREVCGRGRGQAHKETVYRVADMGTESEAVITRKAVGELTLADLDNLVERKQLLRQVLSEYISTGTGKASVTAPLPRLPNGPEIKKVSLVTNKKAEIIVRGGAVARSSMVRTDVFKKVDKKGKPSFYLIPVYVHQIADQKAFPTPPDCFSTAAKNECNWTKMTFEHEFMFSLHSGDYVELVEKTGEVHEIFYSTIDRSSAGIIGEPRQRSKPQRAEPKPKANFKKGAFGLADIRKFSVGRLGEIFEIKKETRTWRGKVCT